MTTNRTYTKEYKERVLKSLQPPESKTVAQVAKEENISKNTIHGWIYRARQAGMKIPNSHPSHERRWRKEDKLRIVFETFTMNQQELGAYCREHGLYVSDIEQWRTSLENSLDPATISPELKTEKEKNRKLEKELKYKEKALAEAAALLVLRKKAEAIWGDPEED